MRIPDGVCEIGGNCFRARHIRVIFSSSSSLERIGADCFVWAHVDEVCIPDSVRELCDGCFKRCHCQVTFGPSPSLERISPSCFALSDVANMSIPDSVRVLCWGCFEFSNIEEISIPDSVRELCDRCFQKCVSLRRVTFGRSSSLKRIGVRCFAYSQVEEMSIPDRVRELCDECFKMCGALCRVTFGRSSSLEQIGTRCFAGSGIVDFEIPHSVRDIGVGAFCGCPLSSSFHERIEAQYPASGLFAISERIQITVKDVNRLPVAELEVELTDTIDDVKFKLYDKEGIPSLDCGLLLEGQALFDGMVQDYPIQNGSVLHVALPLFGG